MLMKAKVENLKYFMVRKIISDKYFVCCFPLWKKKVYLFRVNCGQEKLYSLIK